MISTVATVPLGVAAALATQNRVPRPGLVRAVFLIPYVLPSFVVATVWRTMLQPDGIVNALLAKVGIDGGLWLNGPKSYWTLILVEIWAAWPFIYLLALAGLQSVDAEVHEASAIDGANWWPKLRVRHPAATCAARCCWPACWPRSTTSTTSPCRSSCSARPRPDDVKVMPMLVYVDSFQSLRFGLSAAMAIVSLLLIAIPLFVYLRARPAGRARGGRPEMTATTEPPAAAAPAGAAAGRPPARRTGCCPGRCW